MISFPLDLSPYWKGVCVKNKQKQTNKQQQIWKTQNVSALFKFRKIWQLVLYILGGSYARWLFLGLHDSVTVNPVYTDTRYNDKIR